MKIKTRKPRCKQVLAVLCNKLETLETIREEIYPPATDFDCGQYVVMVVKKEGAGSNNEVMIPMSTVIFLK
jgi:hypothetical protein